MPNLFQNINQAIPGGIQGAAGRAAMAVPSYAKRRQEQKEGDSLNDILNQIKLAGGLDSAGGQAIAAARLANHPDLQDLIKDQGVGGIFKKKPKQRTAEQVAKAIKAVQGTIKENIVADPVTKEKAPQDKMLDKVLQGQLEKLKQEAAAIQGKKIVKKERQVSPARLSKLRWGGLLGVKPGKPAVREEIETLEPLDTFGALGKGQTTFGDIVPSIQDQQPATPKAAKDKMTAKAIISKYATGVLSLKNYPQSSNLLVESQNNPQKQKDIVKMMEQGATDDLIIQVFKMAGM